MVYNEDFKFYLIPSGSDFISFLNKYKTKEDVPSYNKYDFEPIIDIALKYNLFDNENIYDKRKILMQRIIEETESKEIENRVENILNSHMGKPFLYNLYLYSLLPDEKRSNISKEIALLLYTNNFPVEDILKEKVEVKEENGKIKKLK